MTVSVMTRVDEAVQDSGTASPRAGCPRWVPVAAAAVVTAALVAAGAVTWDGAATGPAGPDVGQSSATVPVPDPRPGTLPHPDR